MLRALTYNGMRLCFTRRLTPSLPAKARHRSLAVSAPTSRRCPTCVLPPVRPPSVPYGTAVLIGWLGKSLVPQLGTLSSQFQGKQTGKPSFTEDSLTENKESLMESSLVSFAVVPLILALSQKPTANQKNSGPGGYAKWIPSRPL